MLKGYLLNFRWLLFRAVPVLLGLQGVLLGLKYFGFGISWGWVLLPVFVALSFGWGACCALEAWDGETGFY